MNAPLVNITIPTMNRLDATCRTINALRRNTVHPHVITVVDNASCDGTREYLRMLRADGVIDHLFLLERNMGVACACNLGWDAVDADFYMKLDNDIEVLRAGWLEDLVGVWRRNGGFGALAYMAEPRGLRAVTRPGGDTVLPAEFVNGACVLIGREVHERLGYWCEDYGIYGEEDADFGARCHAAGLVSAYLPDTRAIRHNHAPSGPGGYERAKSREARRRNVEQFQANCYFYETGLRPVRVGRRYVPEQRDGAWAFSLDRDYIRRMAEWNRYKRVITQANRHWVDEYVAGAEAV